MFFKIRYHLRCHTLCVTFKKDIYFTFSILQSINKLFKTMWSTVPFITRFHVHNVSIPYSTRLSAFHHHCLSVIPYLCSPIIPPWFTPFWKSILNESVFTYLCFSYHTTSPPLFHVSLSLLAWLRDTHHAWLWWSLKISHLVVVLSHLAILLTRNHIPSFMVANAVWL